MTKITQNDSNLLKVIKTNKKDSNWIKSTHWVTPIDSNDSKLVESTQGYSMTSNDSKQFKMTQINLIDSKSHKVTQSDSKGFKSTPSDLDWLKVTQMTYKI